MVSTATTVKKFVTVDQTAGATLSLEIALVTLAGKGKHVRKCVLLEDLDQTVYTLASVTMEPLAIT